MHVCMQCMCVKCLSAGLQMLFIAYKFLFLLHIAPVLTTNTEPNLNIFTDQEWHFQPILLQVTLHKHLWSVFLPHCRGLQGIFLILVFWSVLEKIQDLHILVLSNFFILFYFFAFC